jgi:hypothetical protein
LPWQYDIAIKETCAAGGPRRKTAVERRANLGLKPSVPDRPGDDPKYWRERAEEARSIAKLLKDQEAKRQLLAIASRYERLADHIKQRPKST